VIVEHVSEHASASLRDLRAYAWCTPQAVPESNRWLWLKMGPSLRIHTPLLSLHIGWSRYPHEDALFPMKRFCWMKNDEKGSRT
jgi:hypothetical protein